MIDEPAAQSNMRLKRKLTAEKAHTDLEHVNEKKGYIPVQYDTNGRRITTNTPALHHRRKKQKCEPQTASKEQKEKQKIVFVQRNAKSLTNEVKFDSPAQSAKKPTQKKLYGHVTPRYLSHFQAVKEDPTTAKSLPSIQSPKTVIVQNDSYTPVTPPRRDAKSDSVEKVSSDHAKNELVPLEELANVNRLETVEGPQILKTFMKMSTPRLGRRLKSERSSANDSGELRALTFSSSDDEDDFDYSSEQIRRRRRMDRMVLCDSKANKGELLWQTQEKMIARWQKMRSIRPTRYVCWVLFFLTCFYCCSLTLPIILQSHEERFSSCFENSAENPTSFHLPSQTSAFGSISNQFVGVLKQWICQHREVDVCAATTSLQHGMCVENDAHFESISTQADCIKKAIIQYNTDAVCKELAIFPSFYQRIPIQDVKQSCPIKTVETFSATQANLKFQQALSLACLNLPGSYMLPNQNTLQMPLIWVNGSCYVKITFLYFFLPVLLALAVALLSAHRLQKWLVSNADRALVAQLQQDLRCITNSGAAASERSLKATEPCSNQTVTAADLQKQFSRLEGLTEFERLYIDRVIWPRVLHSN